ncbi:MAG: hypothetical protein KF866_02655 [Phycisphaeraceae bacterium]|nr:hypothetical protein [Phycisphaeraceae bacterium]MCW5753403.1 hypothetical protein [Phycisphaeraceae bacterium]
MKPSTAKRVRETYTALADRTPQMVEAFYRRVFAARPDLVAIFPPDMSRLQGHFGAALALIARNVERIDALEQPLMSMGARHLGYGVKYEDYPIVGEALLATLEEFAGVLWTPEVAAAWKDVVSAVSAAMLRGAAVAAWESERPLRGQRRSAP